MEFKEGEIIRLPEKREVLFEKSFKKDALKQIEMKNFVYKMINNCEIKYFKYFDNSVFFIKDNKIILELKNKSVDMLFYIKKEEIWSIFAELFELDYYKTNSFMQSYINEFLKLENIPTYPCLTTAIWKSIEKTEFTK